MSTRIVMVDYIGPRHADFGATCIGCPRLKETAARVAVCQHFGQLALQPDTSRTYLRHASCIRAEERTRHASYSELMKQGDFPR